MSVSTLNDEIAQFNMSVEEMVHILECTEEAMLYKKPSTEEWSAMQIVSHVIEAIAFWVADVEALLIVPGAKWGRNHEHVRRLAAVDEQVVANLSKEEAILLLRALKVGTEAALNKVSAADLSKVAPSYNPNFEQKPLSFIIDHLIVKHVSSHIAQMKRHLLKVQ